MYHGFFWSTLKYHVNSKWVWSFSTIIYIKVPLYYHFFGGMCHDFSMLLDMFHANTILFGHGSVMFNKNTYKQSFKELRRQQIGIQYNCEACASAWLHDSITTTNNNNEELVSNHNISPLPPSFSMKRSFKVLEVGRTCPCPLKASCHRGIFRLWALTAFDSHFLSGDYIRIQI